MVRRAHIALMRALIVGVCALAMVACGKEKTSGEGGTTPPEPVVPPGPGPQPQQKELVFQLKVATVNLLKPSGRRSEMSLEKEIVRGALGASIAETGASLIAFNELDDVFIAGWDELFSVIPSEAKESFSSWEWSLEWPNDIKESGEVLYSYSNGFAYDSSVLELKECGYVWLSKEEGGKWYTDSAEAYKKVGSPERTCIWTRFVHRATGKEFHFFVTHLPTESQGGGETMAMNVLWFARSIVADGWQVLCGDFNSAPGSNDKPYNVLKASWSDAYETVGAAGKLGPYATYPGTLSGSSTKYYYTVSEFTKEREDRRIDHIMTRGGCTASTYSTVIHTYFYDKKYWCPSDHLPVVATIDFYE